MDEKPTAPLTPVIITSALTCLVLAGAGFMVREQLLARIDAEASMQRMAISDLTKKLERVNQRVDEFSATPHVDTALVDGLKGELGKAKETIDALNARLNTLESKPEPTAAPTPPEPEKVTVAAHENSPFLLALRTAVKGGIAYQAELDIWEKEHPKSAQNTPHLHALASTGVITEVALRRELQTIVETQIAAQSRFEQGSVAEKLNQRLSGLISIKKQTAVAPELAALQAALPTAPLAELTAKVVALPQTLKPEYDVWLARASERNAALIELERLDTLP